MGREIRRVPKDWRHPRCPDGRYHPMFDETYEEAWADYMARKAEFESSPEMQEKAAKYDAKDFWEWEGPPPNPEYYRPAFESEATHYQVYENVSEGTPTSPVFDSLDNLKAWLVDQGHSKVAADYFVEHGYAPSMVMRITNGHAEMSGLGIDSLDMLVSQEASE